MELVKMLLPLIVQGSLAALVLAVGLDATLDDVLYLVRRPARLGRAFLAISVVTPAVAVLVLNALPVSLPSKVGVILMALAPVPPLAPGKDLKLGGRKAYVYGVYVAFAVLAVAIVPATVAVLNHLYGASADVPMGKFLGTVLFAVLGPLALGMALHHYWPAGASAASVWVGRIALLLIIIVVIPLLIQVWPAMVTLTGDGTILAMTLIAVCAVAAGHLLGGPELADRMVLANTAATRHPGIALMLATANGADKRVTAIILMFVLVTLVVVAIYGAIIKRTARAKPTLAAPVPR